PRPLSSPLFPYTTLFRSCTTLAIVHSFMVMYKYCIDNGKSDLPAFCFCTTSRCAAYLTEELSMSYQAPLREMQFVLYELLKGDEILPSLPGFEDATREIMDAMLTEGAKLAQNVIAPTNVPGDREGCVYYPVAKT